MVHHLSHNTEQMLSIVTNTQIFVLYSSILKTSFKQSQIRLEKVCESLGQQNQQKLIGAKSLQTWSQINKKD